MATGGSWWQLAPPWCKLQCNLMSHMMYGWMRYQLLTKRHWLQTQQLGVATDDQQPLHVLGIQPAARKKVQVMLGSYNQ
jgi:hypothetical protein